MTPATISVLVAGHRSDRLPKGDGGGRLQEVFRTIISELSNCARTEGGSLRVLTGTAEGTDVMAADVAAAECLALHLVSPGLPFALSEAQARAERKVWLGANAPDFLTDEPNALRDEIALGFADILVVVWDGNSPNGLMGGTVRLVLLAALAMKPVIWIDTSSTIRLLDRTLLTPTRRHLLQCPQPQDTWLTECFSLPLFDEAIGVALIAMATEIIGSPDSPVVAEANMPGITSHAGILHNALLALARGDVGDAFGALTAQVVTPYRGPTWKTGLIAPTHAMDEVFDKADVKSSVAAGRHRDATWIIYSFSTMAVFTAVAGTLYLPPGVNGTLWSVIELLLVIAVVVLFRQALKKDWHTTWIEQRFLAEQLRYSRMGMPLLALPRCILKPAWNVTTDSSGKPCLTLISKALYTLQRTFASTGLPCSPTQGVFVAAAKESLPALRDYVRQVVDDQVAYHHRVHHRQHSARHVLHRLSMGLFVLTGAAVVAHFVIHAAWLLIFTAFIPALAAGIHGLVTKLEIARISAHSAATEVELRQLSVAIEMLEDHHGDTWRDWLHLRQLALAAALVMSDENVKWQQLVSHQEPELPA